MERFLSNPGSNPISDSRFENIRLTTLKYSFGMQSIEVLGHIFDEKGVKLSDSRYQGPARANVGEKGFEVSAW